MLRDDAQPMQWRTGNPADPFARTRQNITKIRKLLREARSDYRAALREEDRALKVAVAEQHALGRERDGTQKAYYDAIAYRKNRVDFLLEVLKVLISAEEGLAQYTGDESGLREARREYEDLLNEWT